MQGYFVFLMIELARKVNIIDKFEKHYIAWQQGRELYKEFKISLYNSPNVSEYECIEKFLQWKLKLEN